MNSGFEELYNTILDEFPLLSNAGGIELMRTGFASKSKTLEVIPNPHGSISERGALTGQMLTMLGQCKEIYAWFASSVHTASVQVRLFGLNRVTSAP